MLGNLHLMTSQKIPFYGQTLGYSPSLELFYGFFLLLLVTNSMPRRQSKSSKAAAEVKAIYDLYA